MRILVLAVLLFSTPAFADGTDQAAAPTWQPSLCEGDGCDAYLPILKKTVRFENISGQRKWGALLGGLSGAIIGEELGGAPGAVLFGTLGAVTGYDNIDRKRWEADAKAYQAEWQRGGDMFYDPSRRLPLVAHWMLAGPAQPNGRQKNK